MNTLTTPVALVAGADGGLGLEVARQLSLTGAVVLVAARTAEAAKGAVVDLPALEALGVDLDVTDDESVLAAVAAVVAAHGRLDILVNATACADPAGTPSGATTRTDLEEALRQFEVALFGAWRLTKAFLPLLEASAHPRVVNVSNGAGSHGDPLHGLAARGGADAAYGVGAAGLNALTSLLAAELATGGILVNAVCPESPVAGTRGPATSAPGVVWAATLPDDGPTGGFFRDGAALPW
ncbi:SDR family NAD(P)-dependent oxidoreductase [Pedococcus sp. KACC 23699]|uniref:SDR family NAD(P)-dependent oxidoreductase n=1 Tax=Pedococcus sp. KACC 23699 TaxID=3149228 RepID=A0AAU7JQI9_9MICO